MTDVALRHNTGKPKLGELLFFDNALVALVAVMEQGAVKYARHNWMKGGKPDDEYIDSAMRHMLHHQLGETHDDDTGCLHLAHAAWNLLACLTLNYATEPSIDPDFDQEAFEKRWAKDASSFQEDLEEVSTKSWGDIWDYGPDGPRTIPTYSFGQKLEPEHFGDAKLQEAETELAAEPETEPTCGFCGEEQEAHMRRMHSWCRGPVGKLNGDCADCFRPMSEHYGFLDAEDQAETECERFIGGPDFCGLCGVLQELHP